MASVKSWASTNGYDYRFMDDELFHPMPPKLMKKTSAQIVIATDLARLMQIRSALQETYEAVVWLDADFFIFKPEGFVLPETDVALGREVWVQGAEGGKLKVYKKVHNAFLYFRRGNTFLDFYIETATRLLTSHQGSVPPQFIGPKLLTALHNIVQFPVFESAGVLSPLVIRDLLAGEGPALTLFLRHSTELLNGANLCASSVTNGYVTDLQMHQLLEGAINHLYG
ncbi:MAG: hypothetical protein OEZ23_03560 [Gammaproteobacteria bacterium]|nr:hypothetical protein [Gammaproteobacteria bacterium]